jgi:hypothetical protein
LIRCAIAGSHIYYLRAIAVLDFAGIAIAVDCKIGGVNYSAEQNRQLNDKLQTFLVHDEPSRAWNCCAVATGVCMKPVWLVVKRVARLESVKERSMTES